MSDWFQSARLLLPDWAIRSCSRLHMASGGPTTCIARDVPTRMTTCRLLWCGNASRSRCRPWNWSCGKTLSAIRWQVSKPFPHSPQTPWIRRCSKRNWSIRRRYAVLWQNVWRRWRDSLTRRSPTAVSCICSAIDSGCLRRSFCWTGWNCSLWNCVCLAARMKRWMV